MTDRELLKLAAKAAGVVHDGVGYLSPTGLPMHWNPLNDDGDALRLAVRLGLGDGTFRLVVTSSQVTAHVSGNEGVDLLHNNDPLAATRRAIVRAAAEIGKTK